MIKKKVLLFFLISCSLDATNRVVSFFPIRPQGLNLAHEQVNKDFLTPEKTNFSCVLSLTKSFRPERIAQCLFGDDTLECKTTFTVSGSQTTTKRAKTDWLADYFGLPTDFVSKVRVKPRISNTIFDVYAHFNLDHCRAGAFARIHIPLVYTSWDLNMRECIIKPGTNAHDPGYFNQTGVTRSQLMPQFLTFIQGNTPTLPGVILQPLQKARMKPCSQRSVQIADIHATLGMPFVKTDWYQFGAYVHGVAPTSEKPNGKFLFEPLIGNGGHAEFGGGIYAQWCLWECESTQESFMLFIDSYFTHLFKISQIRSFDLINGPNSRYMLVQRFEPMIEHNLRSANGTEPTHQFKNEFTTVANLTTTPVDVSGSHHINFIARFVYAKKQTSWQFGYEFWARTCETLTLCKPTPLDNNQVRWALKGDARVFGFVANNPIALSATQNHATINNGLNKQTNMINNNIDNPQPAIANIPAQPVTNLPINGTQIFTSIQPILLDRRSLDLRSAQTEGISHKIFSHVQYTSKKHESYNPYIGFGAEVEFGRKAGPTPTKELDACINCALSYWGIWLKAGISF